MNCCHSRSEGRENTRFFVVALALTGALLVSGSFQLLGCASSQPDSPLPDGYGRDSGSGDAASGAGNGGPDAAGSGGGGTSGTDGGTGGQSGEDGGAGECVHTGPPLVDVSTFEVCTQCDNAHCVPVSLVPPDEAERLADCDDEQTKCVPDNYVESGRQFLLKTCKSLLGAEGRCVSLCVPEVKAMESGLPRDVCAPDELCAPCYDPITGKDTGSCSLSCDTGPEEPAQVFTECCGGISVCVPQALVPESDRESLSADTCAGKKELCVPRLLASDLDGYVPESCRSWQDAEARCLPACLPEVARNAPRVERGTCPEDYLCSPCYDHVSEEKTLACMLGGDVGPTEDPVFFERCCGGLSACVPLEAIIDEEESKLSKDSCSQEGVLCVPEGPALDPLGFIPDACRSWNDSEGRCLPACLPDIAAKASGLDQGTCVEDGCDCESDGYLCAPCFDPITGEDTGACASTQADSPTDDPYTFPGCCESSTGSGVYLSVCVPIGAVPDEQEAMLDSVGCLQSEKCVPGPAAADPAGWIPDKCRSWGGGEGRCLPACLPDIAAQADQLTQGTCGFPDAETDCDCQLDGYLCAPCFDPLTGENSGACDVTEADSPAPETTADPYLFTECCEASTDEGAEHLSRCIPLALVPAEQADMLNSVGCEGTDKCVPLQTAADPTGWIPDKCRSWGGGEGRCLPACLPDIAAQADQLDQGACGFPDAETDCDCQRDGYLCAPCFDPLTGDDTGACDVTEADSPAPETVADPVLFSECCESSTDSGVYLSRCIPLALVPAEQAGMLNSVGCEGTDKCVPKQAAADPVGWVPDKCRSWGGGEGRCLPACLPDIAAMADMLSPGACGFPDPAPAPEPACDCQLDGYLCAPCYDPVSGIETGACRVTAADSPPPPGEKYTFPRCCNQGDVYHGTCVPIVLVTEQQAAALPYDNLCASLGTSLEVVCAPTEAAIDPNHAYPTCTIGALIAAIAGISREGVCLANCFQTAVAVDDKLQADCNETLDECLPCSEGATCLP